MITFFTAILSVYLFFVKPYVSVLLASRTSISALLLKSLSPIFLVEEIKTEKSDRGPSPMTIDGLSQGPDPASRPLPLAPDARVSPFIPSAHSPDDIIPGLCALRWGGGGGPWAPISWMP